MDTTGTAIAMETILDALEEDLGDDTLFEWMTHIREKQGLTDEIKNMYRAVIEYLPNFQIKAGAEINYSLCYQTLPRAKVLS